MSRPGVPRWKRLWPFPLALACSSTQHPSTSLFLYRPSQRVSVSTGQSSLASCLIVSCIRHRCQHTQSYGHCTRKYLPHELFFDDSYAAQPSLLIVQFTVCEPFVADSYAEPPNISSHSLMLQPRHSHRVSFNGTSSPDD